MARKNTFQENLMKGLGYTLGAAVAGLAIAYFTGVFNPDTNIISNPPPKPAHQGAVVGGTRGGN